MMPPCQCCQSNAVKMSIYCAHGGTLHVCRECARKMGYLTVDQELRWLEAQWLAPCARVSEGKG